MMDIREEWETLKTTIAKRAGKYGAMSEEEIEATVRKHRHEKSA
jgi:hypothetical protein